MKKKIVFFLSLLLCFCNSVYAKEYNLQLTKKNYNAYYEGSELGEKNLVSIEKYNFKFDKEGYIIFYSKTTTFIDEQERLDIEYSSTKINENERKMDYKIYRTSTNEYSYYSEIYKYSNNKWCINDSDLYYTIFNLNKNEILYSEDNKVETQFTYQDNQVIIYYSDSDYLFKLKNGYFYEYENTALSKSDNEYSQFDAFGTIEKKQNKYVITYHYDDMSYICEINTNYNFISWKASAFNMLFNIPTIMVIPYTLGFGNGSEFQEGVDYSGETKEVKKNDETLDVVKPVILHSSIIIIIVVVFIIILLMLFIFLFFKKRKR